MLYGFAIVRICAPHPAPLSGVEEGLSFMYTIHETGYNTSVSGFAQQETIAERILIASLKYIYKHYDGISHKYYICTDKL